MKIKEIVELTGLTDRTIRYYIEEGLISPEYSENYFGRRSFCFSEKELNELRDIATLRAYDFSILQIKDLQAQPERCGEVLEAIKAAASEKIFKNQALLTKIEHLSDGKAHTVSEIACVLNTLDASPKKEEYINVKKLFTMLFKGFYHLFIFSVTVLPIALSLLMCALSFVFTEYKYPKLNGLAIVGVLVCLALYAAVLVLLKFKGRACSVIRKALIFLCIFSIPVNILFSASIVEHSETRELDNYLSFDMGVILNIEDEYTSFFPEKSFIEDFGKDAVKYHYRFFGGDTVCSFDVFLECKFLGEDAYKKEVERVKALLTDASQEMGASAGYREYGSYNVYFFPWGLTVPFEERWQEYYTYVIFAFDDGTNTVRYIYNLSSDFAQIGDKPYYAELSWR